MLKEVDAQRTGQSACAIGAVRVISLFHSSVSNQWVLFGAQFRSTQGIEAVPYLMAMSPANGLVPAVERLAVVNTAGIWKTGYGLFSMKAGWLISLVSDTPEGAQNKNCLDNLYVVMLPEIAVRADTR